MATSSISARFCLLIACILSFLLLGARAQATTTTASIYPGTSAWMYYGCYNETTLTNGTNGLRALNGGPEDTSTTMTVPMCLSYCASNSFPWAGLEYTTYVSLFLLYLLSICVKMRSKTEVKVTEPC